MPIAGTATAIGMITVMTGMQTMIGSTIMTMPRLSPHELLVRKRAVIPLGLTYSTVLDFWLMGVAAHVSILALWRITAPTVPSTTNVLGKSVK